MAGRLIPPLVFLARVAVALIPLCIVWGAWPAVARAPVNSACGVPKAFGATFSIPEGVKGGEQLESEPLEYGGHTWQLVLYPRGYRTAMRSGYSSVYLQALDDQDPDLRPRPHQSREVAFSISLLQNADSIKEGGEKKPGEHGLDSPAVERFCHSHDFENSSSRWGFMKFAPSDAVLGCAGPGGTVSFRLGLGPVGSPLSALSIPDMRRKRGRDRGLGWGWLTRRVKKQRTE
ncbi:unnamed protein product, partial [Discosporangium mesarthrocarpum]